jgi:hypothetical protein
VYGSAKFHVPDAATLAGLFPGRPVFQLWNAAVNFLPDLPRNGTCLAEEGAPTPVTWQIQGNYCKAPKPVYDSSCHTLWAGALSSIPTCP